MNIVLLLGFIILEIGLAIRTIKYKSSKKAWAKERLFLNGIEILLFLVGAVCRIFNFGIRFKLLFIILCVRLFVSGIVFGIQTARNKGQKKSVAVVVGTCFGVLLLILCMTPSFIFSNYNGRPLTGDKKVAITVGILVDGSREETFEKDGSKREVPVHFFYPADGKEGERYPLVIFSHGAFGYYESNASAYQELASHGYVVASLDHPYHSFFTKDTSGKMITVNPEFINDVTSIDREGATEKETFRLSREWLKPRVEDINFVIDTLKKDSKNGISEAWHCDKSEEEIDKVLKMTDCDKIGVMGHSLGGAAAVSIGRNRTDIGGVIDLDGTMLGEQLGVEDCEPFQFEGETVSEKSIVNEEAYNTPILALDSEKHHNVRMAMKKAGLPYANNAVLENATEGFSSYIAGAEHMDFTDLPLFAPLLGDLLGSGDVDSENCIDTINHLTLEFFDCYLKGGKAFSVKEAYEG